MVLTLMSNNSRPISSYYQHNPAFTNNHIFWDPNLEYLAINRVPVHHWLLMSNIGFIWWKWMILQGPPYHYYKIPKPHRKVNSAMPNYRLWMYAGNSNNDGILWCVNWHFSSLKIWVEGVTVTRNSETLDFSHLGTPTYNILQLVGFLYTIGCSFPALESSDGNGWSCRVPLTLLQDSKTPQKSQLSNAKLHFVGVCWE